MHISWKQLYSIFVFLALQSLVVAQIILADQDGFLTVAEMQQRGYAQGLPLIWHFGIWGDFLIISALVAVIVAKYSSDWSLRDIALAFTISSVISLTLMYSYTTGSVSGAHVVDHQTTQAGYMHTLYMVIAIAIVGLLYFFTPGVSRRFIVIATVLLIVHVFFGTHLALGLVKALVGLPWYAPEQLRDPTAWMIFAAVVLVLGWRAYRLCKKKQYGRTADVCAGRVLR